MKIYCTILLTIAGLTFAEALQCWVCENQPNNEACRRTGRLKICQFNERACQNEVRVGDRGMRVTKRCKQALACDNNFIQNKRPAWMPSQCNIRTPSSVCRCCCDSNGCNNGLECNGGITPAPQRQRRPTPLCQVLLSPSNGRMQCNFRGRSAVRGRTCSFFCNSGYQLKGFSSSRCMLFRNGQLRFNRPTPACAPNPIPKCLARNIPENGAMSCSDSNLAGSACLFSCDVGYVLTGNDRSFCSDDGTWSDDFPVCVKITCFAEQTRPQNGAVACTDSNNVGSICRYSCNDGYDLIGPTSLRGCFDNKDGTSQGFWSGSRPTCQPKQCEPKHVSPENGEVSCSNENFVGSNCTFQCNSGYSLTGSASSVCLLVSDEAVNWSSEAPTCEFVERAPVRIGDPPRCSSPQTPPTNGKVSCTNGNELQSECTFSCDEGYALKGEEVSICDNGISSPEWTSETPVCEAVICEAQSISRNGDVTCTSDSDYNSVCSFQCNKGYSLYPANVTENICQENASWSSPTPCCARMCPPYSFMDAVIILDSSGSIRRPNWNALKKFIRGIIDLFEISPDSSRVAVFRYNRKVDTKTQIFLDSFPDDKTALLNKYDKIPYNGGGTHTGQALQHARNVSFAQGNRPEAKDVLIVVTDGRSQDDVHTISQELRSDGVLTYAIGIVPPNNRGPDESQLLSIAGQRDHYFLVKDGFAGLNEKFSAKLEEEICSVDPCSS